jgi:hypothetical protein
LRCDCRASDDLTSRQWLAGGHGASHGALDKRSEAVWRDPVGLGGDEAAAGAEPARLLEVVDAVLAEGDAEAGPRGGGGRERAGGARRVAAGVRDGALGDDVVVVGAGEDRVRGHVEDSLVARRCAVQERHLDTEHRRGHRPPRHRLGRSSSEGWQKAARELHELGEEVAAASDSGCLRSRAGLRPCFRL